MPGGRFRVFANDFEVQKGTIRFDDPTRIAPHVDITGVTEYRRYNNTVTSAGSGGEHDGRRRRDDGQHLERRARRRPLADHAPRVRRHRGPAAST